MVRKILFLATILLVSSVSFAQKTVELKEKLRLQMPNENGSNGASVAWNPKKKHYYAAFAGNGQYPLAVFSAKGKLLSDPNLTTQMDVRGLWFNPETDRIEGNGYADNGWFHYDLDEKGMPTKLEVDHAGTNQLTDNDVATWDGASKNVMIWSPEDTRIVWFRDGIEYGDLPMTIEDASIYNSNVVLAMPEWEGYGLYNPETRSVVVFSYAGEAITQLVLPESVADFSPSTFNLAYANGLVWVFDKANRTWIGFGK